MQSHSYLNLSEQEEALLHYYRRLDDVARREFANLVAALAPQQEELPDNVIEFPR